ncbi:MAG: UTP--glucose-1-phosphate uridylyltransferase, partial [Lachnospiraceae bacterium]|nr:UTP--glucose-1-phosphate uridylyltransferase [Lachnospiraceae bacterium]
MGYEEIKEMLNKRGQEQLLRYYDELSESGKEELLKNIEKIDFSVTDILGNPDMKQVRGQIEPLNAVAIDEIEEKKDKYNALGLDAVRQGKVGAILLAGGQGTRLGFDKPKGTYNVGVNRELYIFECLINNLMDTVKKAKTWVPIAVMTSNINHDDTVKFFKEHGYFGYNGDYVYFFIQDMTPATDYNGKIYLADKDKPAMSPNGNGGWFTSFVNAGLLEEFNKYGVEWLNVFAVDNVLQRIADPCFIGATIDSGCVCGAKVVSKAAPDEKIGLLVKEDGKPSIVEYYEMTDEMMHSKDENGNRLYNYGVILNYLFSVDEMLRVMEDNLPVHVVEKKIPYIDENGTLIKPSEPNGYKFELLVLDLIHLMRDCLSYEVD